MNLCKTIECPFYEKSGCDAYVVAAHCPTFKEEGVSGSEYFLYIPESISGDRIQELKAFNDRHIAQSERLQKHLKFITNEMTQISGQNNRSIRQLAWAIENSLGEFKLLFVSRNYDSDRLAWAQRLREICTAEIRTIELSVTTRRLYQDIQAQLGEEEPEALLIFGLEAVQNLAQVLELANAVREEFRDRFRCPVVFWASDRLKAQFIQFAPDLESWGTTIRE